MKRLPYIGFAAFLFPLTIQAATPEVEYSISPVMEAGALRKIAVEVRLKADPSGKTAIELPDEFGGKTEHYRLLSPIGVTGGKIAETSPAERVISSAPKAPLVLRYMVEAAYSDEPVAKDQNLYKGAVIRPSWFSALGNFFIVQPKGREEAAASLHWRGWPKGWIKASSEDDRSTSVANLVEANYMGGSDLQSRTLPIEGGRLRLFGHGNFPWSVDSYADRLAQMLSAQRRFWGDRDGDFTVTMIAVEATPGISSSGGTSRKHGFTQYSSPDTPPDTISRTIAHEHSHNWIPNRLGTVEEGEQERSLTWLSEGFTEFYAVRTLLRANLWTPQQFADDLNHTLARWAGSPVKTAPNSRIVEAFWTDAKVQRLPYDRGNIFAHRLDYELKKAGKQGLDAVMFAMRDRWAAAPDDKKPELRENFLSVLDAQGFDARPLLARYIENGEAIDLPGDLFGSCASVETVSMPGYDIGFETARTGKFSGVRPDGPAYAAGLRDGMERLARLAGEPDDSRVEASYKVLDNGQERILSWFPRGVGTLTLPEVKLSSSIEPSCSGTMSR